MDVDGMEDLVVVQRKVGLHKMALVLLDLTAVWEKQRIGRQLQNKLAAGWAALTGTGLT
jgi:hypothetical protein